MHSIMQPVSNEKEALTHTASMVYGICTYIKMCTANTLIVQYFIKSLLLWEPFST